MNKYIVIRHIERNGYETRSEYGIEAVSPEQAISRTRYKNTRTDKHPNGEATDYTDKYGAHIWWTAELVESVPELEDVESIEEVAKPNSWTVGAPSVGTSSEIAVRYMLKHPDSFRGLESARRTVNFTIKKLDIKTPLFSFKVQKNTPSVVMDVNYIEDVPEKYLIPQDPKIDKKLLKADIEAGEDLDGIAHIERSESVRIR